MRPSRCALLYMISMVLSLLSIILGSLPVKAFITAASLSASANLSLGTPALAVAKPKAALIFLYLP